MLLASRGVALFLWRAPTRVLGPIYMDSPRRWAGMPSTELLCAVLQSGEGVVDIASCLSGWRDSIILLTLGREASSANICRWGPLRTACMKCRA